MASGKTTIGRKLAEILNRKFIDTDELIEKREGMSISEIFERYGESYFRDVEEKAILEAVNENNTVIATGGGCVIRESTRRLLKEKGIVFWLKVDAETVLSRTNNDNTRPLLKEDKERKINTLLLQREPLYIETAHYTIDALESPEEIVSKILDIVSASSY
ncbi:MAG: shikimate kinase [bacterium]|nr:shikimate kinase [bacterium]